jgi:hypothetical protein
MIFTYEVIIHDETAESLKHLFLPPAGSHVTARELQIACARLAEATRAAKRLQRLAVVGEGVV